MATELRGKELKAVAKKTDVVTAELQKGFTWTVQHSKIVWTILGGLVLIGAGLGFYDYKTKAGTEKLQSRYYDLEHSYNTKKKNFDKAAHPEEAKKLEDQEKAEAGEETPTEKHPKAKVEDKKPESTLAKLEKATGDMDKDYGTEVLGLRALISENSTSSAAKMAALLLSDIYQQYGKTKEAAELTKSQSNGSDLLSILNGIRSGNLFADAGDCPAAIDLYSKLVQNTRADFGKAEIYLRMGMCYQQTHDLKSAEEQFKKVDAKSEAGRRAQKFLRFIHSQMEAKN